MILDIPKHKVGSVINNPVSHDKHTRVVALTVKTSGRGINSWKLERLKTAVYKLLRDEQAGFRAGRSCIDQIAEVKKLQKEYPAVLTIPTLPLSKQDFTNPCKNTTSEIQIKTIIPQLDQGK